MASVLPECSRNEAVLPYYCQPMSAMAEGVWASPLFHKSPMDDTLNMPYH